MPGTTTARSEAIARARVAKASHIAAVLRTVGCDAETAATLTAHGRALAERAALVRPASEETWTLVVHILRILPDGHPVPAEENA